MSEFFEVAFSVGTGVSHDLDLQSVTNDIEEDELCAKDSDVVYSACQNKDLQN